MLFSLASTTATHPVDAQPAPIHDPFQNSSCIAPGPAQEFLASRKGFVYIQLHGERLSDRGKHLSLDTGVTNIPFDLVFYSVPEEDSYSTRWAVLLPEITADQIPGLVCPIMWGITHRFDGALNLKQGFPTEDVIVVGREEPAEIQRVCSVLRPKVAQAIESTLEEFGGKAVTLEVAQALRELMLVRKSGEDQKQIRADFEAILQRSRLQVSRDLDVAELRGDARCDGLTKILSRSKPDQTRVIAQLDVIHSGLFGDLFGEDYGLLTVLLSSTGRWQLLMTYSGGATVRFAQGETVMVPTDGQPLALTDK